MNIKLVSLIFVFLLSFSVFAKDKKTVVKDSYVEYPFVVFVGQIVKITPFSVIVENTDSETLAQNSQLQYLIKKFSYNPDFRAHGFANALKVVSIKNDHMRLNFYLDNINKVFHNSARTYLKFLPLFYLFKNNFGRLNLPEKTMNQLKKLSLNYYLSLPFVKKILKNSWFVGVFRVHPESGKLVYYASRYYKNLDELNSDKFAKDFRVPQIVNAGLTVSITKVKVWGHETQWVKEENLKKKKSSQSNNPSSSTGGSASGAIKRGDK